MANKVKINGEWQSVTEKNLRRVTKQENKVLSKPKIQEQKVIDPIEAAYKQYENPEEVQYTKYKKWRGGKTLRKEYDTYKPTEVIRGSDGKIKEVLWYETVTKKRSNYKKKKIVVKKRITIKGDQVFTTKYRNRDDKIRTTNLKPQSLPKPTKTVWTLTTSDGRKYNSSNKAWLEKKAQEIQTLSQKPESARPRTLAPIKTILGSTTTSAVVNKPKKTSATITEKKVPVKESSYVKAINRAAARKQSSLRQIQQVEDRIFGKPKSTLGRVGKTVGSLFTTKPMQAGAVIASGAENIYLGTRGLITGEGASRKSIAKYMFVEAPGEALGQTAKIATFRDPITGKFTPESITHGVFIYGAPLASAYGGRTTISAGAKKTVSKTPASGKTLSHTHSAALIKRGTKRYGVKVKTEGLAKKDFAQTTLLQEKGAAAISRLTKKGKAVGKQRQADISLVAQGKQHGRGHTATGHLKIQMGKKTAEGKFASIGHKTGAHRHQNVKLFELKRKFGKKQYAQLEKNKIVAEKGEIVLNTPEGAQIVLPGKTQYLHSLEKGVGGKVFPDAKGGYWIQLPKKSILASKKGSYGGHTHHVPLEGHVFGGKTILPSKMQPGTHLASHNIILQQIAQSLPRGVPIVPLPIVAPQTTNKSKQKQQPKQDKRMGQTPIQQPQILIVPLEDTGIDQRQNTKPDTKPKTEQQARQRAAQLQQQQQRQTTRQVQQQVAPQVIAVPTGIQGTPGPILPPAFGPLPYLIDNEGNITPNPYITGFDRTIDPFYRFSGKKKKKSNIMKLARQWSTLNLN